MHFESEFNYFALCMVRRFGRYAQLSSLIALKLGCQQAINRGAMSINILSNIRNFHFVATECIDNHFFGACEPLTNHAGPRVALVL